MIMEFGFIPQRFLENVRLGRVIEHLHMMMSPIYVTGSCAYRHTGTFDPSRSDLDLFVSHVPETTREIISLLNVSSWGTVPFSYNDPSIVHVVRIYGEERIGFPNWSDWIDIQVIEVGWMEDKIFLHNFLKENPRYHKIVSSRSPHKREWWEGAYRKLKTALTLEVK